jgi:hypothetical protein
VGSTEILAVGFVIAFWIAVIAALRIWHTRRDGRRRTATEPRGSDDTRR